MKNSRLTILIALAFASSLSAQIYEHEELGEVSAYTGIAFGGTGTSAVVGGATGFVANKYAIALIDTSFMPLGSDTLRRHRFATDNSRLYDFNFTVQIPIPIKRWNKKWAPYGLLGAAFLFNTYQVKAIEPGRGVVRYGTSDELFGFHTGGGIRYYVKDDWGLKGEFRVTASSRNFGRILFGVFYRFSGPWP